jgi:hypothetical protein
MTADQVRLGARVRDLATGRTGTVVSVTTLALGIVSVRLDPDGYDCSTAWIDYADLERIRDPLESAT